MLRELQPKAAQRSSNVATMTNTLWKDEDFMFVSRLKREIIAVFFVKNHHYDAVQLITVVTQKNFENSCNLYRVV
jgi:hypothetical protein